MSQKNALFEEFDDEIEADIETALEASEAIFEEPVSAEETGRVEDSVDPVMVEDSIDPVQAEEPELSPEEQIFGSETSQFEERPIPAITIQAFYETDDARQAISRVADDRRLNRATIDMFEGGLSAALEHLKDNPTPNLLLIESLAPSAQLIAEIDALAQHCDEGVEVMVLGATNDIQLYRQLVARGVSEYLVPPIQPMQVIQSISTLFTDPDQPFLGRTVGVIGAKGGVGASTVAHNLAWSLAENARINTTLVDLDLSFGTTALDFNDENAQTVLDALTDPDRADDTVIDKLLSKPTSHLSLFTAPASISNPLDIPSEAYEIVIEGVRRNVPFVVLDLPHIWTDWVEKTLLAANDVIVVCQPDLASLRNGKNLIDRLTAGRSNDLPPRVVINMAGVPKRPEIPVKDFAGAIGVEPEVILPFDPQLFGTAANNGQMLSEADPEAKPSLALDHLASMLSGRSVEAAPKSLLQKLLGK